jgi:hypothetical protein
VKRPERQLLARLNNFVDSVLVAGCQRSGTTALTRSMRTGCGMADFRFCRDDELAGALLLAGQVEGRNRGRCCFQTTYLNDRIDEYFAYDDFRLIWMIREPTAVVYSMLHNWKRGALRRLYDACGTDHLARVATRRNPLLALGGPSRLEKACASYIGKARQTSRLLERLGPRMLIVDYDEMVLHRDRLLPLIFDFADITPGTRSLTSIHRRSIGKGKRLSRQIADRITGACGPVYAEMRQLRTIGVEDA